MLVTDKEVGGTTKKPGHDAKAKKNELKGEQIWRCRKGVENK